LVDACDIADIVAPHNYSPRIVQMAILKSKHVLLKSRLPTQWTKQKEIVKLTKEANIKFQVGHVERFNPAFSRAQRL